MASYCESVLSLPETDLQRQYHDRAYGYAISNDHDLFARLVLEINQAGLSWITILKKQDCFFEAYDNFDVTTVANYGQNDIERLLQNSGIIRNRLKIGAAIHNAQKILQLQQEFGSFAAWLDMHAGSSKIVWTQLFKKHFKFTGGEIVGEFLMSTGYLSGAHDFSCPIYTKVLDSKPSWSVLQQVGV